VSLCCLQVGTRSGCAWRVSGSGGFGACGGCADVYAWLDVGVAGVRCCVVCDLGAFVLGVWWRGVS